MSLMTDVAAMLPIQEKHCLVAHCNILQVGGIGLVTKVV